MTPGLDVAPQWYALVQDILRRHAPRPCRVVAFGSRVKGRARRFSDLDLAFDAGRPLTVADTAPLEEAFDESDLPWRVDIVDLATCSETFRREVESHAVPVFEREDGDGTLRIS